MSSILTDTKKSLGIAEDDTAFDLDVMLHINNAFSNLNDIGVGPTEGFVVEDDTVEWEEFFPGLEDSEQVIKMRVVLSKVKSYVYLKAKLAFDPPAQGFLLTAVENQIREHESRISMNREAKEWVDPRPPTQLLQTDEVEI